MKMISTETVFANSFLEGKLMTITKKIFFFFLLSISFFLEMLFKTKYQFSHFRILRIRLDTAKN